MFEKDCPRMTHTILVVSSEAIKEHSLIWDLLRADYQVRYAASDSSALKIAVVETPSAILLTQDSDNVQEICSSIRRIAPSVPLFVIGREGNVDIRVKFFQADADDYIREPFSSDELIARIRSAVRRSNNAP
jgi:two-component system, OmpR family, KDP operon response regulator KdpE